MWGCWTLAHRQNHLDAAHGGSLYNGPFCTRVEITADICSSRKESREHRNLSKAMRASKAKSAFRSFERSPSQMRRAPGDWVSALSLRESAILDMLIGHSQMLFTLCDRPFD